MKMEGIPIARDRAGNTLVRVPYDKRCGEVETSDPADGITLLLFSPENVEISVDTFEMDWYESPFDVWDVRRFGGLAPMAWNRWILSVFFRINILDTESQHFFTEALAPLVVPSDAWKRIEEYLLRHGVGDLSRTLGDSPDRLDMKELRLIIGEALGAVDLVGKLGRINDRWEDDGEIIGFWQLILYRQNSVSLKVCRQRQGDGTTRIAYNLSSPTGESGRVDLTRFSLVDVLRDSGVWAEEGSLDAWLGEHMVQVEWLIDPSKLEMYNLLGLPSPLLWEYGRCKEWAEAGAD